MNPWQGKRRLTIVTACLNAPSSPDLVLTEVDVTHEEHANGVHCDLVEAYLRDEGYQEPFFHFDEFDAPLFLIPAVRRHFGTPMLVPAIASQTQ